MAVPSDLFSFDNVADSSARQRRADVAASTSGMVTNMMGGTASSTTPNSSFRMAENNPQPANSGTWNYNLNNIAVEQNPYTGESAIDPTGRAMRELQRALTPISTGLAGRTWPY